jgi:hypothetical protein
LAKTTKKTKAAKPGLTASVADWFRGLEEPVQSSLKSGATRSLLAVALVIVAVVGLSQLERYVHGLDRFDRDLKLSWENLPIWLQDEDNRHVLDSLTARLNLRHEDRLLDGDLAARLGDAISDSSIGWIKSVDRVMVRPGGVVSIYCQFREPSAWVRQGRHCYLVDDQSVRLPGTYLQSDCDDGRLLMVLGVEELPPAVGQVWPGDDLGGALALTSLIDGRPFRGQIRRISVANYGGRVNRSRPHVELITDRNDARIWWGRAPREEFGAEISASQKIALLETLYRQCGRVDMNRSYVNIMTWPDRVAMPAAMSQASTPARLLRG